MTSIPVRDRAVYGRRTNTANGVGRMLAKGHGDVKEIKLAGGTLTIASTFNPMELVDEERRLVFGIVDLIRAFEITRAQQEEDQEIL